MHISLYLFHSENNSPISYLYIYSWLMGSIINFNWLFWFTLPKGLWYCMSMNHMSYAWHFFSFFKTFHIIITFIIPAKQKTKQNKNKLFITLFSFNPYYTHIYTMFAYWVIVSLDLHTYRISARCRNWIKIRKKKTDIFTVYKCNRMSSASYKKWTKEQQMEKTSACLKLFHWINEKRTWNNLAEKNTIYQFLRLK